MGNRILSNFVNARYSIPTITISVGSGSREAPLLHHGLSKQGESSRHLCQTGLRGDFTQVIAVNPKDTLQLSSRDHARDRSLATSQPPRRRESQIVTAQKADLCQVWCEAVVWSGLDGQPNTLGAALLTEADGLMHAGRAVP